jgi:biopolymer transport protein ExbD
MNFRRDQTSEVAFQIAPMIDVVFLLLCFFVTSQIFATYEQSVPLKLPTASTSELPQRLPGEIIINLNPNGGGVIVNQRDLTFDELGHELKRLAQYFPSHPVIIRADKATDYEFLMEVLDRCRQADIYNIRFATTQSKKE